VARSSANVSARWYLDENVAERLASLLNHMGYDAIGTTAAGNKGTSDADQLLFALRNDRVLLTHNAHDFELIHRTLRLWSDHWELPQVRRHAGVLLFPDSGQLPTAVAAHEIDRLAEVTSDFSNQFVMWRSGMGWTPVT
jgi:hypothetical protein